MDALLEDIPARLFDEWAEFYGLEPWGGVHEDLRAGIVAAAVYNANAFRSGDAIGPEEFFPSVKAAMEGDIEGETAEQRQARLAGEVATMLALAKAK